MQKRLRLIIPGKYRDATFWLEGDKIPFLDWLTDEKKLLPFVIMHALHLAAVRNLSLKLDCQFYVDANNIFLLQCKTLDLSSLSLEQQAVLAELLTDATADLLDTFFPIPAESDSPVSYCLQVYLLSYCQYLSEHYTHEEQVLTSALITYFYHRRDFSVYGRDVTFGVSSKNENSEHVGTHKCSGNSSSNVPAPEDDFPTLKQMLGRPSGPLKTLIKRLQHFIKVKDGNKPIDDTALLAAIMTIKSLREAFRAGLEVRHDLIAPPEVNQLLVLMNDSVDMQLCCSGENDGKSWFEIRLSDVLPSHFTASAADILQRCCEFHAQTQTVTWSQQRINNYCGNWGELSSSVFSEFFAFNRQFDDPAEKRCLLHLVEEQLNNAAVGQVDVKNALLSCLRQNLDGAPLEQRGPVFIYGASGVGKTSLAKTFAHALNLHLFDSYALDVINMEQFYHRNSALQLFGAGLQYNAANLGTLTTPGEFLPKRIIVFDEIEKAHRNTLSALLTLLSERQVKDASSNRLVDFSECIFIFTSNTGEHSESDGFATDYRSELATAFSPEFINRISRGFVAKAKPLTPADTEILAIQQAYDLALEFGLVTKERDLAQAICLVAGELNPRAMLGAVSKIRTLFLNALDAAQFHNAQSATHLSVHFEATTLSLTDWLQQQDSRIWQAPVSVHLSDKAKQVSVVLQCGRPAALIAYDDKQSPFMHFHTQSQSRFEDLIGNNDAIAQIRQMVCELNKRCSAPVDDKTSLAHTLLVGPPGSGKTHLARAIAGEFDGVFIQVNASELTIGDTDKNLKTLFNAAKKYSPCIVFIDEIDAIASKRQAETKTFNLMVNSLLTSLDGFSSGLDSVLIIGATNHPEYLDGAVVRAGRLSHRIELNFPARAELKTHIENTLSSFQGTYTPSLLDGMVAKLQNSPVAQTDRILNSASAINATNGDLDKSLLDAYLQEVAGKSIPGDPRNEEQLRIAAYHEAGHALVISQLFTAEDVLAIDVNIRTTAQGLVLFANLPQKYGNTRLTVKKQLQVLMAGRAAEQILFNDPNQLSMGDAADIRSATRLAKQAINQWGFSGVDDMVDRSQFSVSEAELQQEVNSWIKDAYNSAQQLCKNNLAVLERLATALCKSRVLYFVEIQQLLKVKNTYRLH